jgi:hypothetical protein
MTAFWDIAPRSLVDVDRRFRGLVLETVRSSETSVYFNETTLSCMPEDCHLHTRRRGNLKSRKPFSSCHVSIWRILFRGCFSYRGWTRQVRWEEKDLDGNGCSTFWCTLLERALRDWETSFPFPFVPLQRRGCLVVPWFLWIVLVPCAGD